MAGFRMEIGHAEEVVRRTVSRIHGLTAEQMFFVGFTLAFALLHFILFLVVRTSRASLFFSLFLLFYAANIFFDYRSFLSSDVAAFVSNLRWHRFTNVFLGILLMQFFYALVGRSFSYTFWALLFLLLVTGVWAVWKPLSGYTPLQVITVVGLLNCFYVIGVEVRTGNRDARYIAAGLAFFTTFLLYDVMLDLGILRPVHQVVNAYQFGTFGLFAGMSVFLARDIAAKNRQVVDQARDLERQALQRQILELENRRKTTELEEARTLQLSMLPAAWPRFAGLSIASYIETATEVGGDYYDYELAADGTLTVVVGDATGHGTRAGLMVAIVKSLFRALVEQCPPVEILDRSSGILKSMKLQKMYMAFQVVQIKNREVEVVSAGIPPLLLYRAADRSVEQIRQNGMPLGAFTGFRYPVWKGRLDPGDTILMMTDGLPETFNPEREQLDMDRIGEVLRGAGDAPPEVIVKSLRETGERWRNGATHEDDITLVVIQATRSLNGTL